mmetsp:Transcript_3096/g.7291  ORF Transcript_3096/g.7291 Transcript_3096/m.7291 type:complete len:127 (-) Transcript_3096:1553-1933(-)
MDFPRELTVFVTHLYRRNEYFNQYAYVGATPYQNSLRATEFATTENWVSMLLVLLANLKVIMASENSRVRTLAVLAGNTLMLSYEEARWSKGGWHRHCPGCEGEETLPKIVLDNAPSARSFGALAA